MTQAVPSVKLRVLGPHGVVGAHAALLAVPAAKPDIDLYVVCLVMTVLMTAWLVADSRMIQFINMMTEIVVIATTVTSDGIIVLVSTDTQEHVAKKVFSPS